MSWKRRESPDIVRAEETTTETAAALRELQRLGQEMDDPFYIALTVKWPELIPRAYREQTFTGQITDPWPSDPPDTIRLRTGGRYMPEKLVPERYVVERDNEVVLTHEEHVIKDVKIVYIPSSDGNGDYTVTFAEGRWTCTCKGFHFRAECRHIRLAAEASP